MPEREPISEFRTALMAHRTRMRTGAYPYQGKRASQNCANELHGQLEGDNVSLASTQ